MSQVESGDHHELPTFAMSTARDFRPTTRPTFQIKAQLGAGRASRAPQEIMDEATGVARAWLETSWRRMTGQGLPIPAPGDSTLHLESAGGYRLQIMTLPERMNWCARLEHPDLPFGERPAVAGRAWATEVALRAVDGVTEFGLRVLCTSHEFSQAGISLTRPRIVLDLSNRLGLSDARQLLGVPWTITTESDVEELEAYLLSTARTVPVIAVSENYSGECAVDPDWLARKLQGFGTVARLTFAGARAWTGRVGQPWSVYLGAVRTYNPGLRWNEQSPLSHHRALPDSILAWVNGPLTGSRAFTKYLVYMAARHAAYRRINWEPLLFVSEARREASQIAVRRSSNDADLVATLKLLVENLQDTLVRKDEEFENWLREHEVLDEQCQSLRQENGRLSFALDSMRMQLAEKLGGDPDDQIPAPANYDELPDWIVRHFSGRLLLSPRALRGIKDAVYEEFDLVWKGLAALAREYRDLRLGAKEDSGELWEAKLVELGLECENAASDTSRGKYADEYEILDPFGSGKKRSFERDLKKGNSRDARYCLRIYFYWDEEHRQVVVGWLPSHLTITSS